MRPGSFTTIVRALVLGVILSATLLVAAAPAAAERGSIQGATVISSTQVKLVFKAAVDASADDPAQYAISPYLEILSAERVDGNRAVLLTTSPQTSGVLYRAAYVGTSPKRSGSNGLFAGTSQGANDAYTFHDDFNRASGLLATDSPIPGPWTLANVDSGNEIGTTRTPAVVGTGALRALVTQTGAENDDANVRAAIGPATEYWASAYVLIPSGQFWSPTHEVGLLRLNQFADTAHARLTAFGNDVSGYDLRVNWKESAGIGYHGDTLAATDVSFDQWHWLQLHVKNGPAGTGVVQVFVDGVVTYSQDTIAVQSEPMKFLEAGIMHTVTTGAPSLTYTDELRAGDVYQLPSSLSDTIAPTGVAVTAPADGALVEGSISLAADATDDHGVQRVEFSVDGIPIAGDDTAPYTGSADVSGLPTGDYAVTATAYDTSGNATTSDAVTVTIDNSAQTRGATVVSSTQVKMVFDQPVDPGADDPARYSTAPALDVSGAAIGDGGYSVLLTTAPQTNGVAYAVSMTSITGKRAPTTADFIGTTQGANDASTFHDDFNRHAGLVTGDSPIPGPWSVANVDAGNTLALSGAQVLGGSRSLRSLVTNLGAGADDAHLRAPIGPASEYWVSGYALLPSGQSWETGHEVGLLRLNQFADTAQARLVAVYTAGGDCDLKVDWKESTEVGYHGDTTAATGVTLDEWHWIQLRVKNGAAGTGVIQVFVDGVLTYSQDTIAVQEVPMTYLEAGIMQHLSTGPASLTFTDEVRAGTTYQLPSVVDDTTAPSAVTVTAPSAGALVDGSATLTATATDDRGVQRVEFLVDGLPVASDDTPPYSVEYDASGLANGSHVIAATAYDTSANTATSDEVAVTVDNSPPARGATVVSSTQVKLVFDHQIDAGADDPARYSVTPALAVTGAAIVDDGYAALLTTDPQTNGVAYTVEMTSATGLKTATSAAFLGTTQGPNGALTLHDDFNRHAGLLAADTPIPGPWSLATVDPGNSLALTGAEVLHGSGALRAQVTQLGAEADDAHLHYPIGSATEFWASAYVRIPDGQGWENGHEVGLLRLNQFADTAHARLTAVESDGAGYEIHVNWKESAAIGYHGDVVVATGVDFDAWHWLQLHVRNGAAGTGVIQVFVDGEIAYSQESIAVQTEPVKFLEAGIMHMVSSGPTSLTYTDELRAGAAYQLPSIVSDTTAPTDVTVTSPAPSTVIDGSATLQATASDDVSVQRIEFLVDDDVVGSDDVAPYSTVFDATGLSSGDHDVTARAVDTSGNATTSAPVTVTVDNAPPVITGQSVAPHPFSPNGDGVTDTTTVRFTTEEPTTYRILIVNDSTGLVQQTLRNWTAAGAGEVTAIWNGLYWDAGAGQTLPAPEGWYTVRVEVLDHVNRPASVEMPLALNRVLSTVTRSRSAISPNGDLQADTTTVSYQLLGTATVGVTVENGSGTVVRTVQAPVEQTAGSYTGVIWDGRDDGGTVVPDGTYQVRVTATNAVGPISIARSVRVDTTRPVCTLDSLVPQPWYPAVGLLTVTFTVDEPGTAVLRFYRGTSGTATKTITQPVAAAGTVAVTWDGNDTGGTPAAGGTYKLRLWYDDSLGNDATVYPVETTFLLLEGTP